MFADGENLADLRLKAIFRLEQDINVNDGTPTVCSSSRFSMLEQDRTNGALFH
jgi:hypothetical protein